MYLGPERTAAFIRQALAGALTSCATHADVRRLPRLRAGDLPRVLRRLPYRAAVLLILQAGRRLTEVPPPLVAKAEELGRDAGKAAAGWVFDGNTPEEEYQRVLRGIEEGDPAVLDAAEPPAIGPAAGYDPGDLARDLGIEPADRALPRAVSAYAGAFTGAFWQETERAARDHAG